MLKGWQGDVSTETSFMQKGSGMSLLGSCSPEVPQTPCRYSTLKNEHSVCTYRALGNPQQSGLGCVAVLFGSSQ